MRIRNWTIALIAAVVLVLAGCGSSELEVEEVLTAFEDADLGIAESEHIKDILGDMIDADEQEKEDLEDAEGIMFVRTNGGPFEINIIAEVNDEAERDEIIEELKEDEMAAEIGVHLFGHKNIIVMMVGQIEDEEAEKYKKTLEKL